MLQQVFALLILVVNTFSYDVKDTGDAMAYLGRFGYLGKDTASSMNIVDAAEVLKEFQHMAGINETGVLDPETLKMMNTPRCGNLDLEDEMIPDEDNKNEENLIRRKRYKISETKRKWQKRELTYRITKFSDQMNVNPQLVERDVAQAFKLWEGVTNLNFIPSKDKHVDIELGFASAKHHDAFPFDGPGKTLAHAFSPGPGLGGDVHFDDHEKWTVDSPAGTNVLFVAVHEIGHSLGLSHSDTKGAIMQAFYGGYRPHLMLHHDDVEGIQHLYGKRSAGSNLPAYLPTLKKENIVPVTPKSTPPATPTKKPVSDWNTRFFSPAKSKSNICSPDAKVDAMTTIQGNLYIFAGTQVFKMEGDRRSLAYGWPKEIVEVFKNLEPNIEAAFTRRNGKSYFFKGGKYWRSSGFSVDEGYPKSVSKHFPGIPDHVDSAFESPNNEQIYFTKGKEYWRFDPLARGRPHVQSIYPLPISLWGVSAESLDAAELMPGQNFGKVTLIKRNQLWELDTKGFSVVEGNSRSGQPELKREKWLHCPAAPHKLFLYKRTLLGGKGNHV